MGILKNLKIKKKISELKDEHSVMRELAAEALGETGDTRAVEPLIAVLTDEEPEVREKAAEALRKIGWQPKDEEDRARFLVASKKWDEVRKTGLGLPAVKLLVPDLRHGSASIRDEAAKALGEIGNSQAVEPLIGALRDESAYVRTSAAEALEKMEWKPKKGTAEEVWFLVASQQWDEISELDVLVNAPEVVRDPLMFALKDEDSFVRADAAEALGDIGLLPDAVEPLVLTLKDEEPRVRMSAARALGQIQDARAIKPLEALGEQETDHDVLEAAKAALREIQTNRHHQPLHSNIREAVVQTYELLDVGESKPNSVEIDGRELAKGLEAEPPPGNAHEQLELLLTSHRPPSRRESEGSIAHQAWENLGKLFFDHEALRWRISKLILKEEGLGVPPPKAIIDHYMQVCLTERSLYHLDQFLHAAAPVLRSPDVYANLRPLFIQWLVFIAARDYHNLERAIGEEERGVKEMKRQSSDKGVPLPVSKIRYVSVVVVTDFTDEAEVKWWEKEGYASLFCIVNPSLAKAIGNIQVHAGFRCAVQRAHGDIQTTPDYIERAIDLIGSAKDTCCIMVQTRTIATRFPHGETRESGVIIVIAYEPPPGADPWVNIVALGREVLPMEE